MLRILLSLLLLMSLGNLHSQMTVSSYYNLQSKFELGDTSGLYSQIFDEGLKHQNNFYNVLAKGDYFYKTGDFEKALNEYMQAFPLAGGIDTLTSIVNYKIGFVYYRIDNYPVALKYLNKASLVYNYAPQNDQQARLYVFIALIHHSLGSLEESKKCYNAVMAFFRKTGNKKRLAAAQNNMALTLFDEASFDEAQLYLDSSLAYRTAENDHYGMGQVNNNIGTLNFLKGDFQKALWFYKIGYEERIIGKVELTGLLESQINIGKTYRRLNDSKNAVYWLERGLRSSIEINHLDLIGRATLELKDIYFEQGEFKKAFELQEMYFVTKDSLFGLDKKGAIENLAMENRFEMKIRQDSISNAEKLRSEKVIAKEKEKTNSIIVYTLCGGLLFLSFFIFQLYKSNQNKKKTNALILLQKSTLDLKQKEILDSINYAKKIQYALLAHDDMLSQNLTEHFVLFKPKDIVSGDFYWATSLQNSLENESVSNFYLAVCDSTGHGVPGAFMSLLNTSYLNESINEKKIFQPNEVFNFVRKRLIENISHEGASDGMDAILVQFIKFRDGDNNLNKKFQLNYAAANNAPFVVRDKKLIELPYDKIPVGKGYNQKSFEPYSFQLMSGDMLYLCTDGYADQFGGENLPATKAGGKKFKKTNLKKLLCEISHLSQHEQKQKLQTSFEKWSGDLEQVDDVCILGIRI